jgi:hypothetical protein
MVKREGKTESSGPEEPEGDDIWLTQVMVRDELACGTSATFE